jgi:hypothetical protein
MGTLSWQLGELFGAEPIAEDELDSAVSALTRAAFGHDADPAHTVVDTVPYAFQSPATGALLKVGGRAPDGRPWALFCKVLQHPRHWRLLDELPEFVRTEFLTKFPWRQELGLWEAEFLATMPDGIRPPARHALVDLGDDRLALWTELVIECDQPWDLVRYAAAAGVLGRWNQRASTPEVLATCPEPPLFGLHKYAESAVPFRGLLPLADDELWSHPWLAGHATLRATLLRLGPQVPAFLAAAAALPLCRPHGDASPQNLLVPVDAPDELVAIDISFQSPCPLGADLSQLAVGLVHADVVPAADLPAIVGALLPAYVEGLCAEGWAGDVADVEFGFCVSALVRSGFDGFRYELLAADPEDEVARRCFDQRVALSEFIAGRALATL